MKELMVLEARLNSANTELLKSESGKANVEKDLNTLKLAQD